MVAFFLFRDKNLLCYWHICAGHILSENKLRFGLRLLLWLEIQTGQKKLLFIYFFIIQCNYNTNQARLWLLL